MASLIKLIRWFGLILASVAAILALMAAIVAIIAPRVDLGTMRSQIEAVAGQILGRSIVLQGPLSLRLSLPPAIEAAQIRIRNPSGWSSPKFARVDKISASVSLIPLLRGQIVIDEIYASGISLSLEAAADGRNNWTFAEGSQQAGNGTWNLVAINQLSLRDLTLQFNDQAQKRAVEMRIEGLTAKLPADEQIRLKVEGTAQDFPFSIDATVGSLTELLTTDGQVPVTATLGLNNNKLRVTGTVTNPLEPQKIDVTVQLEGKQVADLATVLDVMLPEIGEYQITGDISGNLHQLALSGIDGHLGKTSFSGDLQLRNANQRTRIEGSLVARTLDMRPWSTPKEAPEQNQPAEEASATTTILSEADLHLEVIQFINLPVEVKDASLALTLRNNSLTAPLQVKIDDVVVQGEIAVERKNGEYRATAALHAQQVDVGDLLERYTDLTGLAGRVGTFSVEATSKGADTPSLIDNLSVSLQARNAAMTYVNESGETPIAVDLKEVMFHGSNRQHARMSVDGRLLGEHFVADLELGDLRTVLENRSLPFDLHATGAGAELTLDGQLSGKESTDDTTLQARLSGKRFGDLANWLDVSPEADASFSLTGELSVQSDRESWQLRNFHAQLGRSSIDGSIGRTSINSQPLLKASLAFEEIDPLELERFFSTGQQGGKKKSSGGVGMDLPTLPKGLNLKDMDIDIKGERVFLEPSDIKDIAFSTRIRDGYVSHAPFRGTLAKTRFSGVLAMDLRGNIPEVKLDLEALEVNVGNFLRELQLAREIEAHSERLKAQVIMRGSSISELVDDTEINIEAHSGTWLLTDPNQAGTVRIEVPHGTAKATTRDRHTIVKLDARIDGVPMDFTLETERLQKRPGVDELLDTKIKAIVAGAELTMQGLVPRLSGLRGLDMHISLRGNRINSVNELFKVSLPPFGPYSIDGRLRIGDTEYTLSDITVRVGETVANGNLKLSTVGAKPQLSWMLEAKTFQLDDFRLGDWSPVAVTDKEIEVVEMEVDKNESSNTPEQYDKAKRTQAGSEQPLLSREVMRGLDGTVDIRVGEVLSGQDRLGFGDASIELRNGRLSLSLDLDLPGGEAALELSLQANEQDYAATLRSKIENFDYGVLARRIKPDTDMAGKFSVDVELASQGKTLSLIDDNANGYFDFSIWPETLRSGIFDLWTANLFFVVLPVLNLQTQSEVNCLVGRLDFNDGIMTPDPLFMDTTRTQVTAKGEINFRTQRIKLRLTPRSKRPKFFSLSTPVVVGGSFSDFNAGLRPDDLFGTVIRMMATVILVPGQYITQGVRPSVDKKRCEQAIGVRDE